MTVLTEVQARAAVKQDLALVPLLTTLALQGLQLQITLAQRNGPGHVRGQLMLAVVKTCLLLGLVPGEKRSMPQCQHVLLLPLDATPQVELRHMHGVKHLNPQVDRVASQMVVHVMETQKLQEKE